jgi:DNA-binding transcriptional LysR family regulator
VVEAVKESSADFGICLDSVDTADLQLLPYETDRLVVAVPPTHPLARYEKVAFADTLEFEFVGLAPESRMSSFLLGAAARQGRTMTYRMNVASFDVAGHIIAEGLAIGILPHDAVKHLQQKLGLVLVPLDEEWAQRRIILCMRDYDALSMPSRMLVDHLGARGLARAAARG